MARSDQNAEPVRLRRTMLLLIALLSAVGGGLFQAMHAGFLAAMVIAIAAGLAAATRGKN